MKDVSLKDDHGRGPMEIKKLGASEQMGQCRKHIGTGRKRKRRSCLLLLTLAFIPLPTGTDNDLLCYLSSST
ncbi:hypothetical protein VNO78_10173 [Psophocarpus tetragonolobus]|uniref:Uncharacterized protein n=1 Tax=Psophocarpus tetragonolobus TaxID=3891 RepID=A0AAN9SQZ8_PSOTE